MFPLGTVLVPSAGLPLHVFEPRYRALVHDCLAGDREFGVVLIERGSEVGGEDVRTDVGTVARIVEAVELPDGRWALAAVGHAPPAGAARGCPTIPTRSRRWRTGPTRPRDPPSPSALAACHRVCCDGPSAWPRRPAMPPPRATVELADDPVLASYQAIAVAPLGTFDQQRLLAAESPDAAGRPAR